MLKNYALFNPMPNYCNYTKQSQMASSHTYNKSTKEEI